MAPTTTLRRYEIDEANGQNAMGRKFQPSVDYRTSDLHCDLTHTYCNIHGYSRECRNLKIKTDTVM